MPLVALMKEGTYEIRMAKGKRGKGRSGFAGLIRPFGAPAMAGRKMD